MRPTNPCGNAHFPNASCRECEAIKRALARADVEPTPYKRQYGGNAQTVTDTHLGNAQVTHKPDSNARGNAQADTPVTHGNAPLTPAEKQRRYRQRQGDAYRERNRDRMRRVRATQGA